MFTSVTHKLEVNVEYTPTPVGLVLLDGGLNIQTPGPPRVGPNVVTRATSTLAHVIDGKDFRIKGSH